LTRSLVAGNTAGYGVQEISHERGYVTADNFNLFGHSGITTADAIYGFTPGLTDITATSDGTMPTALTDILDSVLAPNGGPTKTHNIELDSPAVDPLGIDCTPLSTDQRGAPRPFDGDGDTVALCDIGAVEFGSPAPPFCGNTVIEAGDQCDDGNTTNGDGCSSACQEEGDVFNFGGFLQPVDNPPAVNQVKAGLGIPVKFSLGGNFGLDIFADNSPTFQPAACTGGTPDPIEQTVTAGGSGLTYDATTNTYTYVWKTQKGWAGKCGVLSLTFTDGTAHTALFQFK
jgi:cysteine-rich repeat protein